MESEKSRKAASDTIFKLSKAKLELLAENERLKKELERLNAEIERLKEENGNND